MEESYRSPRSFPRRILMRVIAKHVDAYFAVGGMGQLNTLLQAGVQRGRIFLANEQPGLRYWEVEPEQVKLTIQPDTKIILFLGRFVTVKGVEYLIRAFAILEKKRVDAALILAGDGPLSSSYRQLAKELGINNVRFTGYITEPARKSYLFRRSAVMVVPSVTTADESEAGPIVVLEALSAGLPVIVSSEIGSSKEFIEPGVNGTVVPARDPKALAEAIEKILVSGIEAADVLSSFDRLRGHSWQIRQFSSAVECACDRHEFG